MARPSKYTPDREQRIVQALQAGNTRKAAAQYAGIDENTLGRWFARFEDFRDRAREAEAQAEIQAVAVIRKGIQSGDTADAKWWLERRRSDDWGRRDKVEVTVDIEQRVRIIARELGLDEEEAVTEAQRILGAGNAAAR